MSYKEAIEYMNAQLPMFHRVGAAAYKANLDNTLALCSVLGNPQTNFKCIHIAGTNGKGSVAHMLASILQQAGIRAGLYTSPHLKDFRERIRVNGKKISKAYVPAFISKHMEEFEKISPSFFELAVAMAFQYFKEQHVHVAIVEVGMGGRLDSTNIIAPLLSVITNISLDHMQFLGETVPKIAQEKAGIIKPGVPVLIGERQDTVDAVFRKQAKLMKSEINFASDHYSVVKIRNWGRKAIHLNVDVYKDDAVFIKKIPCPLGGDYQMKNLVTLMGIIEELNKQGFGITAEQIKKGIRYSAIRTGFKGRWHVLNLKPLTICDTGHNEAGILEVIAQIANIPYNKLHFVFGTVSDKNPDLILKHLPVKANFYFCKADIPRGMDADSLKQLASEYKLKGKSFKSVTLAYQAAKQAAKEDDLIFIGGSTFVVGEVI
ncbi:MAG: bifunctional folylpolyglutamate synthase/dihydrofolate synthase [Bacteroidetes bacterium]|nr:bifunctional folylpolyglutamate synthase/dihydrofolate synthase [Bacteroidota bacterium]